jgi:hypothetical protein
MDCKGCVYTHVNKQGNSKDSFDYSDNS